METIASIFGAFYLERRLCAGCGAVASWNAQ